MKISDHDAIQHGRMALRADADACQLPYDARTQALLYRAAELLGERDELVAALEAVKRETNTSRDFRSAVACAVIASEALAKVQK